MAEERPPRLVDYFVIAGLAGNGAPIPEETWIPEPSGPLRPPRPAEPITDVAVIARALGEEVPQGYTWQVYGPVHSCCPAGALRPDGG